jgi:hypothetical protein
MAVQEQLASSVSQLEASRASLAASLRATQSKLREAEQAEKDKEQEHARSTDLLVQRKVAYLLKQAKPCYPSCIP